MATLVVLQAPPLHDAALQGLLVLQLVQAAPPLPHLLLELPAKQVPPEMQPEQLAQAFCLQVSPEAEQSAQAAPFLPHCLLLVPVAQTPVARQQPRQFFDPQAGAVSGWAP